MKAEFGFCLVCEKEIAKPCPTCGTKKAGEEYNEIEVLWSNQSKMRIAVCRNCAKKSFSEEDKKAMTEAHFKAWDKLGGKFDKAVVIV